MQRVKLYVEALSPCGKRRYNTIGEAEEHRRKLASEERHFRPLPPPLTVYHCSQCDAFHVGCSS